MYHKAKKSMGQNFLKSKQAIRDIVVAGEIAPGDVILEIGPGKGVLTEALLSAGAKVIAVEKDDDLIALLSEKFENEIKKGSLVLKNKDVLEITNDELRITNKNPDYKIIANIPYNITGAILEKFLTAEIQPERMVLMVQKEVAQRIVARRDGKESILSLSVKAFGEPKYIGKVPAKYFSPAPKVDSAILGIFNINRNNFKIIDDERKFFEIVKTGFAHKRKLLRGNLSKILTKEGLDSLAEKSRAEDIHIKDWLTLTKYFDNR